MQLSFSIDRTGFINASSTVKNCVKKDNDKITVCDLEGVFFMKTDENVLRIVSTNGSIMAIAELPVFEETNTEKWQFFLKTPVKNLEEFLKSGKGLDVKCELVNSNLLINNGIDTKSFTITNNKMPLFIENFSNNYVDVYNDTHLELFVDSNHLESVIKQVDKSTTFVKLSIDGEVENFIGHLKIDWDVCKKLDKSLVEYSTSSKFPVSWNQGDLTLERKNSIIGLSPTYLLNCLSSLTGMVSMYVSYENTVPVVITPTKEATGLTRQQFIIHKIMLGISY